MTDVTAVDAQVAERVKEILCEVLELDEEELTPDGHFVEEYGADSLLAIEILASVEKEFGVEIDQAELPRMVNLNAVLTVLGEILENR